MRNTCFVPVVNLKLFWFTEQFKTCTKYVNQQKLIWSSNFGLIEEIMSLSGILLAVLSAARKKGKSTGLYCFTAKGADWKGSFLRSLSLS